MQAVVLVGGLGTRLRPLTESVPKQLLPILGRTMLERVVAQLAGHGIDGIVLSMGYQPDAFQRAYPDGRCAGLPLTYAVEPEPRDTGGGIAYAARQAGIDDTFVVVNGDVLHCFDVGKLVAFHDTHGGEATVAVAPVADPSDLGVVVADDEGRVTGWVEKPGPGNAPSNLVNAGTYVLEPEFVDRIPTEGAVNIERVTFPAALADGQLWAHEVSGWWLDVGTIGRFVQVHADLLAQPGSVTAPEIEDDIWVEGDALLAADLRGPSYIGAGAQLQAGATIEASTIGAGATVAPGALVRQSVVLAGAEIGPGATVIGAVVGGGAVLEAGTSLAPGQAVGFGERVAAS